MMETERRKRDGTFFVVQLKSIGNVVCENLPEKLEVRDISAQWNTIMVHAKHLSHNDTIYQSGVKCNKFSVYTSVSHPCTSNSSTSIDPFIYFSRSCCTETKADARAPLPFHFNSIFVDFCKWFSLFTIKKRKTQHPNDYMSKIIHRQWREWHETRDWVYRENRVPI